MLTILRCSIDQQIQVLAAHDLFEQLNGNSYCIFTAAAFYKNPFVNYDLVSIYRRILSTDIYLDELKEEESGLGEQRLVLNRLVSVEKRTSAQIKAIQATQLILKEMSGTGRIGCIDLFYFLGSFKCGISIQTLYKIWPNDQLEQNLLILTNLGLLD